MDRPHNFQGNMNWQVEIAALSDHEVYARYSDATDWSESYRYLCYLELEKRGISSIQEKSPQVTENNELKILHNGAGYICPCCGFSNHSFSYCVQCGYAPFEEENDEILDDYIDLTCPKCGEQLSFLKSEERYDGLTFNCFARLLSAKSAVRS